MKFKFLGLLLTVVFFQSMALAKVIVLDVRTPEEYSQGHLPQAINIDVKNTSFKEEVSKLNRDDDYKVYCAHGRRAAQAVTIMQELGFKHLQNLGGLEDARKALK